MEIDYKKPLLERLSRIHQREPIDLIRCNQEEFDELYEEAKQANLIDKSDNDWFTIKNVDFSVHLSIHLNYLV